MKHDVLKSSNSKSISLDYNKKKGLQMGYGRLKGKVKYPDYKKTSEPNTEHIGWVYLFSSAIKIGNCRGSYYEIDVAFVPVKKITIF